MPGDPEVFSDIWEAIEDDPVVAASLRRRSYFLIALQETVRRWAMGRDEAAGRLGVTPERFDDLAGGNINVFSLDDLVALADRAGIAVRIEVDQKAA